MGLSASVTLVTLHHVWLCEIVYLPTVLPNYGFMWQLLIKRFDMLIRGMIEFKYWSQRRQ